MATTDYPTGHPLAVKTWAKKLTHEVTGGTYYKKFSSMGSDSICEIKDEVRKGPGDKITYGLRMLATGAGIQGDNTAEGNEEALVTYTDSVLIDQLREPFRSGGRVSEQRVPFSVREEMRMAAQDWWIERLDTSFMNQLTGNTAQSDTRYTGNNSTSAPSTAGSVTRLIVGGSEDAETSLSATTTHAIKMSDIDKAVAVAKTQSPRIRPVRVDGKNYYVCFLHPYAIYQLRSDASTSGNFFDIQKAQLQGGKISDNPILTGAEFIHNGCIVHESSYLPATVGASDNTVHKRGVVCGAQAITCAYGRDGGEAGMIWAEDMFDYGNQFGISAGMIFGMTKNIYNSIDFATITLAGYAPAP